MTTLLRHHIDIPAPAAAVYDHVSRPWRWKTWHAASLAVRGIEDESLVAGRRFEEDIAVAGGGRRQLLWLVEEARPPLCWRASAYTADGHTVQLSYQLTATESGVRFTRTLSYGVASWWLRGLNVLFLRARIERESQAALQRLCQHFRDASPH